MKVTHRRPSYIITCSLFAAILCADTSPEVISMLQDEGMQDFILQMYLKTHSVCVYETALVNIWR